jgi:hypothetical protein
MDGLVASGTVVGEARLIADVTRQRLAGLAIPGELSLTGSSSIPGLLTKADVDLHLRTSGSSFDGVVLRLRRSFPVAEPNAWAPTLAVFVVPGTGRPTGLAVTPVGSEHDRRFTLAWTRLSADARLRDEYNALKLGAADADSYRDLKSRFFDRLTGQ